jgi:hypothetical protein
MVLEKTAAGQAKQSVSSFPDAMGSRQCNHTRPPTCCSIQIAAIAAGHCEHC